MSFDKTVKKISFIIFLVATVMIASVSSAHAQDDPPDPCTSPDIPCPIDGGLSLLIAAGIGLGAKKAYDRKKAAVKIAE